MATEITIGAAGGEYMETVVVLEWAATVGSPVKQGDTIVTVETAKAATDIEAPCDGFLTAIYAQAGTEVAVSAVLGLVGAHAADTADGDAPAPAPSDAPTAPPAAAMASAPTPPATAAAAAAPVSGGRPTVSPAARKAAAAQGVRLEDLTPSSPSGRIKLRDVAAASAATRAAPVSPLRVYQSGNANGTPVLFLHGFGSEAASWMPVERALADRCRIVKIDLPSHGKSPLLRTETFEALVDLLAVAFDDVTQRPVHVVGHSLGGACAIALAQRRSGQVASLTLLSPAGLGHPADTDFLRRLAQADAHDALKAALQTMVADESLISNDFVGAAMMGRTKAELRAAQLQMANDLFPGASAGFDLRDALAALPMPVHVVWGEADRILPVAHLDGVPAFVAQHRLRGVGHVPALEATQHVVRIVRDVVRPA